MTMVKVIEEEEEEGDPPVPNPPQAVGAPATKKTKTQRKASKKSGVKPKTKTKTVSESTTHHTKTKSDNDSLVATLVQTWLPHMQRLLDKPVTGNASLDGAVRDIVKELDQFLLKNTLAPRNLANIELFTSIRIVASALVHFLDCLIASSDSGEESNQLYEVIALVSIATGTVSFLLDRAVEYASTVLDRVRSQALLFMQFLVTAYSAPQEKRNSELKSSSTIDAQSMNDFLDTIAATLTHACTDKSKKVRHSAVVACASLLQLDSAEVDVLQSVIWIAQHDPVPLNRQAAVHALPVNAETSEVLVARVRDTHASVRVAALQKLSLLDMIDSELLAAIVQSGYTERCAETRDATIALVNSWVKSVGDDPVRLLQKLDVFLYENQCETVVKILLQLASQHERSNLKKSLVQPLTAMWNNESESSSEESASNPSKLSMELLFLARIMTRTDSYFLDQLSWDITTVTMALEFHLNVLRSHLLQESNVNSDSDLANEESCICQQLVLLASALANSEEGSLRHFRTILSALLSDPVTPDVLIPVILQALFEPTKLRKDRDHRPLDEVTEMIVHCIQSLQRSQADDLSVNEFYQIRILSIWSVLLDHVVLLSPETQRLIDDGLEPLLLSAVEMSLPLPKDDPTRVHHALVLEASVGCLGKLGLLLLITTKNSHLLDDAYSLPSQSAETLVNRMHDYRERLFGIARDEYNAEEVRAKSILAITDWSIASDGSAEDECLEELDDLLLSFLDSKDAFLLCVAGEIVVKLLFANKRLSNCNALLARLILLSLDPSLIEENDSYSDGDCEIGSPVRLQQLTSIFFPAYATTAMGRSALVACLPSLLALSKKKKTLRLVSYVDELIHQGRSFGTSTIENVEENDSNMIDIMSIQVAIELARFVLSQKPTGTFLRNVCKAMGSLAILSSHHEESKSNESPCVVSPEYHQQILLLEELLEEMDMTLESSPQSLNELSSIRNDLSTLIRSKYFLDGTTTKEATACTNDDNFRSRSHPHSTGDSDEPLVSDDVVSPNETYQLTRADLEGGDHRSTSSNCMIQLFSEGKENSTTPGSLSMASSHDINHHNATPTSDTTDTTTTTTTTTTTDPSTFVKPVRHRSTKSAADRRRPSSTRTTTTTTGGGNSLLSMFGSS